jgi:hypothetical protein
VKTIFAGGYGACQSGVLVYVPMACFAESKEEAIGHGYEGAMKDYPPTSGWSNHYTDFVEVPGAVVVLAFSELTSSVVNPAETPIAPTSQP